RLAQPAPERCANAAIGSDVAEGLDALLRGVEARKSEASCFRDMNGADGRRLGRNAAPRVQAFKYPPAHITERGGALIEARLSGPAEGNALNQQQPTPGAGERGGKTRSNHAATDDGDIDLQDLRSGCGTHESRGAARHQRFDLIGVLGDAGGEHLRAALRDDHVVLDADADV